MPFISEPERQIPVVGEFDLCVLGGSCTGVFAAVRAARLGLSVAIVERMGCFGGVATLSLVNVWHSSLDEPFEKQIFAGLTIEVMDRLRLRQAVTDYPNCPHYAWVFNSTELQIELDELIQESRITPHLHTAFAAPHVEDGRLKAVVVENKDGRQAIRARFFIDATGDGDLCQRLGLETYRAGLIQPATTCALFSGWDKLKGKDWGKLLRDHGPEFNFAPGFAWGAPVPSSDLFMLAGTRVRQDCSTASGFTAAEMEGRRQVRAVHDILRKYSPETPLSLQSLPARIGIRETRHVRCHHHLTGEQILGGQTYPDEIAYGSYRVDIHHADKAGITLRYLDGRQQYCRPGFETEASRWREESAESPTWYSIPYRSLIPQGPIDNLLLAGRFIDADEEAHGAIRVMVNMNQTGEAAGVAAFLALQNEVAAARVDPSKLRALLQEGGSRFP